MVSATDVVCGSACVMYTFFKNEVDLLKIKLKPIKYIASCLPGPLREDPASEPKHAPVHVRAPV